MSMKKVAVLALTLAAAGCTSPSDEQSGSVSTLPAEASSTTAAPTSTTVAPGTCPEPPPRALPRPDRPRYQLTVDVRPAENRVHGTVSVRFTPDLPTDKLVFRLWPNGPRPASGGASLKVDDVTIDGKPAQVKGIDATTMEVRGAAELPAGRSVTAALRYQLNLPGPVEDRISKTGDAIRLGSFFPILGWEPGRGWATEPPTSGFAEASVAHTADFEATVTVPEGFDVLATGVHQGGGRWSAPAVSDFALSVGHFNMVEATANAPQPVKITVGVHETLTESPKAYLDKVVKVFEDFGQRFGPYPWPAYSLAITPNLGGGIEYPMHVMQGPRTIGRTTSHEVGHEWFFGLVVNNQGRDPWLDEGLATWAEYRYEGRTETLLSRTIPAAGRGKAGRPMAFWESRQRVYYQSVYLQGAQALAALGPPDLVDCALRTYVARNAYRVATPADLIDAIDEIFPDAAEVFARYGIG